jgi:tetratricopeptide (TPR) repeat protein
VALDSPPKFKRHTPTPEAREAYLFGRYYWNQRGPVGWQLAQKYFRLAVEKDPLYSSAYAGLAECRIPTAEAKATALKAVALDPTSGEARTALGRVQLFRELDVVTAEESFKSAIQLDPNYAIAHHSYGELLAAIGHLQEAIVEKRKAAALDPLSSVIRGALAETLSLVGQQEAAERELKLIFEMHPHSKAHALQGNIYLWKRMYNEAIREYEVSQANGGDPEWAGLGYAYARAGNKEAASKVLAQLQALEKQSRDAVDLAIVEIGLSNNTEALAWLETAYQEHNDDGLLWLKVDPIFDPLRSDPRFQDLLRRMKFPS